MWKGIPKSDEHILRLAIPSVVSNITVPLLSLADMAIVGHMGSIWFVSAISIGNTIFNMIYWIFAFLRMGTTGIISQAYGSKDKKAICEGLLRSLMLGLFIGIALLLLQKPILQLSFTFLKTAEGYSLAYATRYFQVCIWGAPAMLSCYSLSGWYIGMHDTKTPMAMAILQNVLNILASIFFVFYLGMGIAGVALGTVLGLYSGLALGLWRLKGKQKTADLQGIHLLDAQQLKRFFSINRDIFLRTLCLVAVTVSFTHYGAEMGEYYLSANALLLQFFMFYSYFMDGLANAAEAMSGELAGSHQWSELSKTIHRLFRIGLCLALLFTAIYMIGGKKIVHLLADDLTLTDFVCNNYIGWAYALPLVALAAFIWDGIFIGLTKTRGMLVSMFLSALCFFAILYLALPSWGNNGLWLAFLTYLFTRGIVQTILWLISPKPQYP